MLFVGCCHLPTIEDFDFAVFVPYNHLFPAILPGTVVSYTVEAQKSVVCGLSLLLPGTFGILSETGKGLRFSSFRRSMGLSPVVPCILLFFFAPHYCLAV